MHQRLIVKPGDMAPSGGYRSNNHKPEFDKWQQKIDKGLGPSKDDKGNPIHPPIELDKLLEGIRRYGNQYKIPQDVIESKCKTVVIIYQRRLEALDD